MLASSSDPPLFVENCVELIETYNLDGKMICVVGLPGDIAIV